MQKKTHRKCLSYRNLNRKKISGFSWLTDLIVAVSVCKEKIIF